jgi:hypothetical protein
MNSHMNAFLFYCGKLYSKHEQYCMARYTFKIATHFNHVPSMRELGILYIKGKGGEVDIYEGSRLLHLAEDAGDDVASIILDSYLEF